MLLENDCRKQRGLEAMRAPGAHDSPKRPQRRPSAGLLEVDLEDGRVLAVNYVAPARPATNGQRPGSSSGTTATV